MTIYILTLARLFPFFRGGYTSLGTVIGERLTHDLVQRLYKELELIHSTHAYTGIRFTMYIISSDTHTFLQHLRHHFLHRHLYGEENEAGIGRYRV